MYSLLCKYFNLHEYFLLLLFFVCIHINITYYSVKVKSLIFRPTTDITTVYFLHSNDKTHFWCFTFISLCGCHCALSGKLTSSELHTDKKLPNSSPNVSAHAPLTDLSKHAPPHTSFPTMQPLVSLSNLSCVVKLTLTASVR